MGVFIAGDHRAWIQSGEALEAVAAQNAGDGGLADGDHGEDLGVGAALTAQGDDVGFQFGFGSARLTMWDRRTVVEL